MARAYEAGAQWAEAMAEYQRVAHFSGARRAKPEQRSAALEAIVRLSPRLGRIVIAKLIKGKCQLSEMWMPPGTQTINIGGELKQVKLLAQDTVTLQECQLKPKPGKP